MSDHVSNTQFPEHWVVITLGELLERRGRSLNPNAYPDTMFELYSVPSFDKRHPEIVRSSEIGSNKQFVNKGMVLLCKINPRINRVWVVGDFSDYEKIASTEWIPFSQVSGIDSKYLAYYMSQDSFASFLSLNASGVGGSLMRIKPSLLSDYPFPLPSLDEQQRIVDEIELQFSRLDAWLEVMQKLRKKLIRLRACILKAAVEGRLVAQDPNDESAEVLLQRILDERRRKWEENYLVDLKAKGKPVPKDDKWKKKYKEPEAPDIDNLPQLPLGWVWATPDQLAAPENYSLVIGPFGSNLKVDDYREKGVPLVFVRNIRSGDFDNTKFITVEKARELSAHSVSSGALLVTKMGDPPGDAIVYPETRPTAVITADCIKWKLSHFLAYPALYVHFMHTPIVNSQVIKITRGIAQKKVSLGRFKRIAVPLPPIHEQKRIVGLVDSNLSLIERIETIVCINLKRAERMRQSILKKAFEGRLVEQHSDDELASELLERIRIEREHRAEEENRKSKQQKERKVRATKVVKKPLYETLKEVGKPLFVRDLFQQAGFSQETIDDFYEELREAVDALQTIRIKQNGTDEVLLEAIN